MIGRNLIEGYFQSILLLKISVFVVVEGDVNIVKKMKKTGSSTNL